MFDEIPLIDHHCHGIRKGDLDRVAFEALISESYRPPARHTDHFFKPLGLLILRDCAPLIGLEPHCEPDAYIERRAALGHEEAARRLLGASGISTYLVDTGHRAEDLTTPEELAALANAEAREVVRIEAVIEEVARIGELASFARRCEEALLSRARGAVGLKSVIAYRATFAIDQSRPSGVAVAEAAEAWLKELGDSRPRLVDPVLLRFGLWLGLDVCRTLEIPLQVHVGFGDPDVYMYACDPTRLTDFLRAAEDAEVPVTLLHNYPFIREAGWLAEIFQNVYYDVGAILNFLGASAGGAMRHAMELGPFGKHLFSSDAFGLPELHYLGALQFRRTLGAVIDRWISGGHCSAAQADRIVRAIASANASAIYPLERR
ncbi:amidohydrolase family protein [Sphingomonas sp. CCH18-H6]|jgi:predicted TIM-barrel fold metal-dependent hydrolase|uniref:amidohydrolase family protein n=1 Tax=Sphingomonas sp. CCH18-H6 TaxID=1768787 RepID=UPI00082B55A0|nr:amidohydrolase family protein [Sphingomonas sp. CCH18-H6]